MDSNNFIGKIFEYSIDGVNYKNLYTIPNNFHTGWNLFVP